MCSARNQKKPGPIQVSRFAPRSPIILRERTRGAVGPWKRGNSPNRGDAGTLQKDAETCGTRLLRLFAPWFRFVRSSRKEKAAETVVSGWAIHGDKTSVGLPEIVWFARLHRTQRKGCLALRGAAWKRPKSVGIAAAPDEISPCRTVETTTPFDNHHPAARFIRTCLANPFGPARPGFVLTRRADSFGPDRLVELTRLG
jgi:hypothetical protein